MSTHSIRFDGQVAIVTGAGGGLGRAFALELARRGASVIVNDYGGDKFGNPGTTAPAQAVVAEIRASGGTAESNATPVGSWQAAREIVDCAIRHFGRLDILVNNAGISIPGKFTDHGDEAVDKVLEVMLHGPYALMRAAWPVMEAQRYGRIVNITSSAVFGVGANASYGAAKAGLMGLTLDTAIAGRELGIQVNAILPTAYSRITAGMPDADYVEWFRRCMPPEKVAAALAYVVSRESKLNGQLLDVGGGSVSRIGFFGGKGYFSPELDAEALGQHIDEALDMSELTPLDSVGAALKRFFRVQPWTGEGNGPGEGKDLNAAYGKKYSP